MPTSSPAIHQPASLAERMARPADRATQPAGRAARRTGAELVVETIAGHASSLLATARRYSLCADDAQDAYQRGLEIFLRRADDLDPAGAVPWLRTVIKHEALAVRAARLRLVGPAEADLDGQEARDLPDAEERASSFERLQRSAEALARLKPHEVRALVLKAHGYSYEEICQITGWTYTKVNRCLTEGRRSFHERFADIEAGRECDRWSAVLSAAADGEAGAGDLMSLRPHLRGCPACRATLREYRMANRGVAAVVPLVAATATSSPVEEAPSLAMRIYEVVAGGLQERAASSAYKLHAGLEAASAGKVAAVAASATALAGSGVAAVRGPLERHVSDHRVEADRPARAERFGRHHPPRRLTVAPTRGRLRTPPQEGRLWGERRGEPHGREGEAEAGQGSRQAEFGPTGRFAGPPPSEVAPPAIPGPTPETQAGAAPIAEPGVGVQDGTEQLDPKEETP